MIFLPVLCHNPFSTKLKNAHEIFRQNLSKSIVKVVTNFFTGNCAVCGKFLTHFLKEPSRGRPSGEKITFLSPLVCFLIAVIYESVSSFWSWLFGRSALSIQMCPAPVIPRDKLILIYIHRGQVSLNYCYLMMILVTVNVINTQMHILTKTKSSLCLQSHNCLHHLHLTPSSYNHKIENEFVCTLVRIKIARSLSYQK